MMLPDREAVFRKGAHAARILLTAYLTFAIVVVLYGESPFQMARLVFSGTWGSTYGVAQVLFKMTPLLFTGLAALVAMRAGIFNVGGEGQLAVGSLCAAWVGAHIQGITSFPLAVCAGMGAGALWALPAAWLRVRLGVSEIISTILLNKIAESVIAYAMGNGLAVAGTVRTPDVAPPARLSQLSTWLPALKGSALSTAMLFAVLLACAFPWLMKRSRLGIEWSQVGKNPEACAAFGIPVMRRQLQVFLVSGAFAGLGSTATVLGYKGYFELGIGAGAGFTGIAVGLLGKGGALAMIAGALLFGTLDQGGLAMNAYVPRDVMQIVVGAVLIAVAMRRTGATSA
jgi:general nucleoside transport system permease protein